MRCKLNSLQREHGLMPPLATLCVYPEKTHEIERIFEVFSFSLILEGSGVMLDGNKKIIIQPPCILIHKKEHFYSYAPTPKWYEVSFGYDNVEEEYFRKLFGDKIDEKIYRINNPFFIKDLIDKIDSLLPFRDDKSVADQLDSIAYLILTHIFFDEYDAKSQPVKERIAQVRAWLDHNYDKQFVIDNVAREFKFTPCDFRKAWKTFYKCSPKKYLDQIRLIEAERLLHESLLPVNQVAERVGYSDQRYFASWFKRHHNISPREYRKKFTT